METLIERWRARIAGNQGSVGILMALVMFFVCGMLIMTWNTYTLSREKIRLQNAVDAAALEHAVWQARGMNTIQHLNDEGYDVMTTAITGYTIGAGVAVLAQAVNAIPVVGSILSTVLTAAGVIVIDVSTWMLEVVLTCIKIIQKAWIYGTPLIAYLSAQQAAAMNGSTGIISHFVGKEPATLTIGKVVKIGLDLYAVGISLAPKDTLLLPVETAKKDDNALPWKPTTLCNTLFTTIRTNLVLSKIAWLPTQVKGFEPTISKKRGTGDKAKPHLPAPTLWICLKAYPSHDSIQRFDQWLFAKAGKDFGSLDAPGQSPFPILAYAVGQCVTGDIIEQTPADDKKVNPLRARGWGTGANAKLISLEEALTLTDHPTLRKLAGLIFYH